MTELVRNLHLQIFAFWHRSLLVLACRLLIRYFTANSCNHTAGIVMSAAADDISRDGQTKCFCALCGGDLVSIRTELRHYQESSV
jgi:hypothetical protein